MSDNDWKFLITKNGIKVKVDAEDYDRITKHSWRVKVTGGNQKKSVITSIRTPKGVRSMTLGQFILNPEKGKFVYPRRWQGGLDYRKQNLIVCTMGERQRMLPKRGTKTSTSVYKGVSYIDSKKCWRARIEVKGKSIFLGDFDTENKAAQAYNKAAREYFGEFAYINQIITTPNRRKKVA